MEATGLPAVDVAKVDCEVKAQINEGAPLHSIQLVTIVDSVTPLDYGHDDMMA